jgi:hypothetical protein
LSYNLFAQNDSTIYPKSIKLKIKTVEVGGFDTQPEEYYDIDADDNAIEIDLFTEPSIKNIKYKYRLKNLEFDNEKISDWTITESPNIEYEDLEAVVLHTFEAVAILPNGVQSNTVSFKFKIELPWWRTWWFWGACFISLFGIFYGRERFLKFWADEEHKHYKQVTELELRTLQLQMNPHFVFNALNAVQSFVMTHDSISANNYLSKFANLIRLFLDSSRSKYISLSDEIKLLSLYIEIEQLRFDGKFDFKLTVAPEVNRFIEIPTMMLQPFVENAINHGLRYSDTKGLLKITFFNDDKMLVCEIEDDGVGRERAKEIQSKSRKGYKSQGLKITEERLNTFNEINDIKIAFSIRDVLNNPENDPNLNAGTLVRIQFPRNT